MTSLRARAIHISSHQVVVQCAFLPVLSGRCQLGHTVFLTPGHARRVGRIAFYVCNVLRLCFAAVPARVVSLLGFIHSMRGMFPPSRECTLPLGFPPSLNFRYCFRFSAFSTQ
jgi:hypothetical protein